ncbi:hypothetical protein ACFQ08_11315, partial [Streptosporangium algeriense]
ARSPTCPFDADRHGDSMVRGHDDEAVLEIADDGPRIQGVHTSVAARPRGHFGRSANRRTVLLFESLNHRGRMPLETTLKQVDYLVDAINPF